MVWWGYWGGFYEIGKGIGVKYNTEKYNLFIDFIKEIQHIIPYKEVVITCRKPIYCKWKSYQLHSEDSPSVLYRDGYALYHLNGVMVSKEIVETSANELNPELIITEKNAEVRREIVRKIGIERICEKLQTIILDKWDEYELLQLPKLEGMQNNPLYLKMRNPSIGVYHLEGVPSNIKTCQEALSWRIGGIKWEPNQLT